MCSHRLATWADKQRSGGFGLPHRWVKQARATPTRTTEPLGHGRPVIAQDPAEDARLDFRLSGARTGGSESARGVSNHHGHHTDEAARKLTLWKAAYPTSQWGPNGCARCLPLQQVRVIAPVSLLTVRDHVICMP